MRQPWQWPRLLVHRCGGALAPENTLAGLAIAARLGFTGVEFDVMLTANGSPVLIHDETLDRTTDCHGPVVCATDSDLKSIDAGVRHHPAFAGETLPSLDDALTSCLSLGFVPNIEIKPASGFEAETGRVVASRVAACWPADRVPPLLSSFSEESLAAAREVDARLPRALLVERISATAVEDARILGCVSLHASVNGLSMSGVRSVRAAGLHLAAYTVDEPALARRLWLAGVAALFTDRPDRFSPNEYDLLMDSISSGTAG